MSFHSEVGGCDNNTFYVDTNKKKERKERERKISISFPSIHIMPWKKFCISGTIGYPSYRLKVQGNK